MKILLIEDEKDLAEDIANYLIAQQNVCEFAFTLEQAKEKLYCHEYDCILLDLMLSDGNGLKIVELLHSLQRQEGVIIISAKNAIEDKVLGLQLGADDYLSKPFHQSELLARIYSVIRRKRFHHTNLLQWQELTIDLLAKSVSCNQQEVILTKKEYDLLLFLMSNQSKVVSKSALAEYLSGDVADMFDSHDFVYAHIKNLKRKLAESGCKNYIKTLYGVGYKWTV